MVVRSLPGANILHTFFQDQNLVFFFILGLHQLLLPDVIGLLDIHIREDNFEHVRVPVDRFSSHAFFDVLQYVSLLSYVQVSFRIPLVTRANRSSCLLGK